jgi:acetyl-CoA carboxylase biotin carboxyl carrier protein
MTNEEIKELLQIFNESGVGELELQRGEDRLRIRRAGEPGATPAAPVAAASAQPAVVETAAPAKVPETDSTHILVKSPIVGTFYDAPSPGAPAFVKVGDKVEVGQVLCIIESMKLMNEIEAEVTGVVASKLVENGRPVEYGESLFAILPH